MINMLEELAFETVLTVQSVEPSTATTTGFVDGSEVSELTFALHVGALAQNKKVSWELLNSAAAAGTDPVKLAEGEYTLVAGDKDGLVLHVSHRVEGSEKRYYGLKFSHDGAAATYCGAEAITRGIYAPAHADSRNVYC
jgi:hypothetical protein